MTSSRYSVVLEIAGPTAMFARPDSGSTPISYPVPTASAAKGMLECVARVPEAEFVPTKVEICRPVRYDQYTTNYGGPLRKSDQIATRTSYQLFAMVLTDVCFKIHADVRQVAVERSHNYAHQLQEMFARRLGAGQTRYTPCLGWKEFVPSYFGPPRPGSLPLSDLNMQISAFLLTVFGPGAQPVFTPVANLVGGVLEYEEASDAR